MKNQQKIVAIGAASGVAIGGLCLFGIYQIWPITMGLESVETRIAYTLQSNIFAILPLLISIIAVGNNRFFTNGIDPTLHLEDTKTQINGRVVENNLQQYALFYAGTLGLSVNLTADQMRIIPAAAITFILARIAFWIGYRYHPLYRAFGMAATGYLNLGLIVFAIYRIFAH